MSDDINLPSPIKTYLPSQIRHRSTKAQVESRRGALYEIVEAQKPMTVRQVFYQATVRGVVEKSEAGYNKVQTDLALMRRARVLPYDWLADNTRWQRKPSTFLSVEHALLDVASRYRKSLWHGADTRVEIWLEKDALSGVILPVTSKYDVPLMVTRGYASLSFLHSAAEAIAEAEVPTHIYHLGDFDPSGVNAGEKIEQTLKELSPGSEIHFQRIAVTEDQIRKWRLPTRPTKTSDSRSRGFGEISVELDAIPPHRLRWLANEAITKHLPPDEYEILIEVERNERSVLDDIVSAVRRGSHA